MITANDNVKKNIRLQDIVAKIARVNLKDTARILQVLPLVLEALGDDGAKSRLDSWLHQSATMYGEPSPLDSKPDVDAVDACWGLYDIMEDEFGEEFLQDIYNVDDRYYMDKVRIAKEESGNA